MWPSNISKWSVTIRHNQLSHSLFTRLAVVGPSTFSWLLFFDIVVRVCAEDKEERTQRRANSKKKRKKYTTSPSLFLSLKLGLDRRFHSKRASPRRALNSFRCRKTRNKRVCLKPARAPRRRFFFFFFFFRASSEFERRRPSSFPFAKKKKAQKTTTTTTTTTTKTTRR